MVSIMSVMVTLSVMMHHVQVLLSVVKQAVQTASYEQKDPLLIYKFESFNLFKALIDKINKDIVSFLIKAGLPTQSSVKEDSPFM